MSEGPRVDIDPERHWCSAHLESFRADWPTGYLPASMLVFAAFTRDAEVWAFCDRDATRLNEAMDALGPMCCRIDEGLLSRIIGVSMKFADDSTEWKALQERILHEEKP